MLLATEEERIDQGGGGGKGREMEGWPRGGGAWKGDPGLAGDWERLMGDGGTRRRARQRAGGYGQGGAFARFREFLAKLGRATAEGREGVPIPSQLRYPPPPPRYPNGSGNRPSPGRPTPGVVKQDKSSGGSIDTTKTRSGPQRVRMSSGERPIGAAKGKQRDKEEKVCVPGCVFVWCV